MIELNRDTNACKGKEEQDGRHISEGGKCPKFREMSTVMKTPVNSNNPQSPTEMQIRCGRKAIQYAMSQATSIFMWAKIINSWYASPSLTLPKFEDFLSNLVLETRERNPKVISGNLNA